MDCEPRSFPGPTNAPVSAKAPPRCRWTSLPIPYRNLRLSWAHEGAKRSIAHSLPKGFKKHRGQQFAIEIFAVPSREHRHIDAPHRIYGSFEQWTESQTELEHQRVAV